MSLKRQYGVVPQGMLAPSGFAQDQNVNPAVQATTRPAGSLLQSSPGYDSIRTGKNRFQGKGPSGGFRPMQFAEDIGGSGAALAVIPGDTASIEATEWLPESLASMPPGSLIISDRGDVKHTAVALHQGMHTIPDMGDRSPGRPLSRLLVNPAGALRDEYASDPIVAIVAAVGVVTLAYILGRELERAVMGRRGGGVASETVGAGSEAASTETRTATTNGTGVADSAVKAVSDAATAAVDAVKDAGVAAAKAISDAGNAAS